ncbi:MAG: hypothetical protein DSM106950_40955, partial [Stigonema ocellatum SAG 48.90 = DSM 106950]|nr:hypothetical protein [Stigonema ocellatum SAG 48.90 = DSM 106950]
QTSLVLTIREIVFEVLAAVRIKQSPLDSYRELSEAAAQGWILPTSVVKQMIKTRPHGEQFIRGSFKFIRTGRIGIEAGWRVERL